MFIIEDESHAEHQDGEFGSFADAVVELRRRSELPWDEEPNVAPCKSWKTCGRRYEIVEFDKTVTPWRELSRKAVLEVSAKGSRWVVSDSELARISHRADWREQ